MKRTEPLRFCSPLRRLDWNIWVSEFLDTYWDYALIVGVPELIVNSVSKADIDLRKTLYSEINLAGGTTMMAGFPERLLNEVRKLVAKDLKV